ncbi:MEDS domain-containing protein [Umezawaea sp.]|uniref:MEDS domain-containing protein n=1 Tax=Umezawaea sp. TaxID=1955258 RepID=UPI002ED3C000
MRRSGLVEHARDLGVHDHVCWRYDDVLEFQARAREFLREGLEQGSRILYTAPGPVDALVESLRGIDGIDRALRDGAAHVASVDAVYSAGGVVDPVAQVRTYANATEAALADGFSGLRVAADVTPLVRSARQFDAFARYEHLADRYMADHAFSALCAYSAADVDDRAFAHVASLHPNTNTDTSGFRLHALGGGLTALGGEVDSSTELFTAALDRVDLRPQNGELVLDATALTFLDHNSLLRLVDRLSDRGSPVVLRTSWPGLSRLVKLLDLHSVRVEEVA